MKLTENKPAPVIQPPITYTLELSGEELRILRIVADYYIHDPASKHLAAAKRFHENVVNLLNLPYNPEVCFV